MHACCAQRVREEIGAAVEFDVRLVIFGDLDRVLRDWVAVSC